MPETPSDRVLRLINAVSQRVENYLQRHLRRHTFTEEAPEQLQGSGGMWLFLSRWPIESVDSVLVDDQEWTFGQSDEWDRKGLLQSATGWPRRQGRDPLTGVGGGERAFNVAVAYTGGYKLPNDEGDGIPLPADLESLVLNEIVLAYRAPRHNVTSEKTPGGWSRTYGKVGAEAQSGFSRESMKTLDFYKRKVMGNP
ncbi:MAG: hypothetical protein E6R03_05070 [Hyphomicrobiaceae bacterium]|nr:MAG: hypothetical protein E6R03_05070 [Hyphomicrobiaceae bacterium]